jgi:hypothetical protein
VFAAGRFDDASLLALKAAEGGQLFDEGFGLMEARFDGEVIEVEGELEPADEVLLGDSPEAVYEVVSIAGADDDGREAPLRGRGFGTCRLPACLAGGIDR